METVNNKQLDSKKIRTLALILFLILGLVVGIILISRPQLIKKKAVGPSCPVNGASCEWDEIPGVDEYEVRVESIVDDISQPVAFVRVSKTKVIFTPEVGPKYRCSVQPVINNPACAALPEEKAETNCTGVAPTETPTPTPTPTLPPGVTPTETPTPTPTLPPGVTPTATPTPTPTPTLPPGVTPSSTPTPTLPPGVTPTSTPTPTLPPGVTPSATPIPTQPPANVITQVIQQQVVQQEQVLVQVTQVIAPTAVPGRPPAPTRIVIVNVMATPKPAPKTQIVYVSPTPIPVKAPAKPPVSGVTQVGLILTPIVLIILGLLL